MNFPVKQPKFNLTNFEFLRFSKRWQHLVIQLQASNEAKWRCKLGFQYSIDQKFELFLNLLKNLVYFLVTLPLVQCSMEEMLFPWPYIPHIGLKYKSKHNTWNSCQKLQLKFQETSNQIDSSPQLRLDWSSYQPRSERERERDKREIESGRQTESEKENEQKTQWGWIIDKYEREREREREWERERESIGPGRKDKKRET